MSKWNTRLTLLHSLKIVDTEERGKWVNIDDFYTLLQSNSHPEDKSKTVRKDGIIKEAQHHEHGLHVIDNVRHISVNSLLRYIFHQCDKKVFCRRITEQIAAVALPNQEEYTYSSHNEVYKAVAQTNFNEELIDKRLFSSIPLPQGVPTLMGQYKKEFTADEWKKICIFEYHFFQEFKSLDESTYSDVVHAKWKFLDKLKAARDLAKECQ